MTGTAGSISRPYTPPTERGITPTPVGQLNLEPVASGVWTPTGLQVVLPVVGEYDLDAVCRAQIAAPAGADVWVTARLFDVTGNAEVALSRTMVGHVRDQGDLGDTGLNDTEGTIATRIAVAAAPQTIRLEVMKAVAAGSPNVCVVLSDGNGYTQLRWRRFS
jgi:hypothetical protein